MSLKKLKIIAAVFWSCVALLVVTFGASVYTAVTHERESKAPVESIPLPSS
jgi:hypothetical protein